MAKFMELWLERPLAPSMGKALYLVARERNKYVALHLGYLKTFALPKKYVDGGTEYPVEYINTENLRARLEQAQAEGKRGKWPLMLKALEEINV